MKAKHLTQAKYDPVRDDQSPGSRIEALERTVALVGELMHVLQQQRVPAFLEIGITMPQAKVLFVVSAAGEMHMSALAERLGVSPSTVSGIVDRLVDQGLVARHDDPADRRQVVISATDAGATPQDHGPAEQQAPASSASSSSPHTEKEDS